MLRRLLWLVPVALLFWNLGYAALWNPDEGRYVAASYEMAYPFSGASDWLVPHLDTVARLNKPPLVYWAMALSFRAFGASEWSARLVPALASLLVLVLIGIWGARCWNWRVGWAGAMVWASGVGAVAMGRTANTDMLLCAAIALTMFGVFWAIELNGARRLPFGVLAGIGMGAALLSKGPVGVALPLLFAAVYLTLARQWKRAPWGALGLAFGVALLVGAPWFLLVEAQRPGFLHTFIVEENVGRALGKENYHSKTPIYYYLPVVLVGLMPWTGFLLPALFRRTPRTSDKTDEASQLQARARLFLLVWAVVLVAFFSASGTKLISYVLPALPAFALLVGIAVADWNGFAPAWKRMAIGVSILLNVVLMVALLALPARDKISKTWGFKPGVLLDDHIVPRAVGVPWTWILFGLLAVFSAALLWSLRRNARAVLAVQSAGAAAIVVALLGLAGTIARYEDISFIVSQIAPQLQPNDRIASHRAFVPSAISYVKRPIYFFQFDNSSGLNDAEISVSPFYSTLKSDDDLQKWLAAPGRAFIVTEGFRDDVLASRLYLWGRTNDQFLLSNQPRPAGFRADLDYTAPDRRKKQLVQPPTDKSKK